MAAANRFNIAEPDLIAFLDEHIIPSPGGIAFSQDIRTAARLLAPSRPRIVTSHAGGYKTVVKYMRERYGEKTTLYIYYTATGRRFNRKAYFNVRLSDAAVDAIEKAETNADPQPA